MVHCRFEFSLASADRVPEVQLSNVGALEGNHIDVELAPLIAAPFPREAVELDTSDVVNTILFFYFDPLIRT